MAKLKETSWMIPIVAQWAAALSEDQPYAQLAQLGADTLKDTCFQLWYPDEKTDEIMYRGPAHYETGITEAPVELPATADEMQTSMKKTRTESPVKEPAQSSASKAGIGWLDFIASRHFRTPLNPGLWQTLRKDSQVSEASTTASSPEGSDGDT